VSSINLQQTLSFLIQKHENNQIQATITALASNPKTKSAYFFDDNHKILASTKISNINKDILNLFHKTDLSLLQEKLSETQKQLKTIQWLSPDKHTLLSATPIKLGKSRTSSLRLDKTGFLLIVTDLNWISAEVNNRLQVGLIQTAGLFALFTAIILIFFHQTIGKRIRQLRLSTAHFKLGEDFLPAEIAGNDELTDLSKAFNSLASQVNEQHNELLIKQHRLNLGQEIANLGSWEYDLVNDKLSWSPQVYRIFGVDTNSFRVSFENLLTLVHPDDRDRLKEAYYNSIENGADRYELEHRIVVKNTGEIRYVKEKALNIKNKEGAIIKSIGMVHDITEAKINEQLLLEQKEEQQQILESMVDAVISINESGTILSFNPAAEKMFQYTAEEAIGQNINILMPGAFAKSHDNFIQNYTESGEANIIGIGRDVEGLRKNGDHFPLHLSVAELPRSNDGARRFIGSCQDVSLQKSQEEQLRQTQKMDALGKLTGGIAHDFNNMLSVIMGFAQLLQISIKDDPKKERYVNEIYQAGERAKKLTSKLLSISRKKTDEQEIADLSQIINDEKHLLEKTLTARIKLSIDLQADLWPAYIETSGFEDVVLNISINAMHAMPEGGSLTITGTNTHLDSIEAKAIDINPGDYVLLTFSDTGTGMSEEQKEKIFDPFFTTKTNGTGLGMSQVYGFVQRSKGKILVYSELGHGTRIAIYLPRYSGNSGEAIDNETSEITAPTGNENILVVDDEPALRLLAQEILSQHGYQVSTAENAADALAQLQNKKYDLVVSDIIMPGMSGYDLACEIKEKYPDIKIQLASGFTDKEEMNIECKELHQNRIFKPFSSQTLLTRIRALLDGKPINYN
ncbi:MAG: PAS domain S-box protein, partial [Gammaproteobacteria bacterium]|nr:PAS domain S-box protein [Gammaproteobacteria bacterium]